MKIAGIIAEYNPFHNGHAYHIAETRRITGCDTVVVVMSGNFVQRGMPAILDKHTRAEMACKMGADLVIELPLSYAVSSAEKFASGGVRILSKIGAEWISFGVENMSCSLSSTNVENHAFDSVCNSASELLNRLTELADLLISEPEEYRTSLKESLASGLSYPVARRNAIANINPSLAPLLDTPNNILAIEYLKAIKKQNSSLHPVGILRTGAGYHDTELSDFASASGIRKAFSEYVNCTVSNEACNDIVSDDLTSDTIVTKQAVSNNAISDLTAALPAALERDYLAFLSEIRKNHGHFPSVDDYSDILYLRLKELQSNDYPDLSDELFNRIRKLGPNCQTVTECAETVKNKSVTRSHIDRALLGITLELTKDYTDAWEEALPYLTVLSCRSDAKAMLGEICRKSRIPFLIRTAKDVSALSEASQKLYAMESAANELYRREYKKATGIALPCDSGRKLTMV